MNAGVAEIGSYISGLDDEFRFFWDYFDFPDMEGVGEYTGSGNDGCVVLEEFEEGLRSMGSISEDEIINYWISYYW